jgi:hypothetical protein
MRIICSDVYLTSKRYKYIWKRKSNYWMIDECNATYFTEQIFSFFSTTLVTEDL